MLRGHIDCITSGGYVEGWAYDTDDARRFLTVAVLSAEGEVAWGHASRFRNDLMMAFYGIGWCAFRLRLIHPETLTMPLRLLQRESGVEICTVSETKTRQDPDDAPEPTEDPTSIQGVWQLQRCDQLLGAYIGRHGLTDFLITAYAYVLGRPADAEGIRQYEADLRAGRRKPLDVLLSMEASDEFRERRTRMAAPTSDHFPFILS